MQLCALMVHMEKFIYSYFKSGYGLQGISKLKKERLQFGTWIVIEIKQIHDIIFCPDHPPLQMTKTT